jgi:hypothetical protein
MSSKIKRETGEPRKQRWNILVEAEIQGAKIQGTIVAHSDKKESAEKLACQHFINQLRGAGIWTSTEVVDEPYTIIVEGPKDKDGKPTEKTETKNKKVTKYFAPYWSHVKALEVLKELDERDLTFSQEELEEDALAKGLLPTRKKRRTSGEVALDEREKKQEKLKFQEASHVKKRQAEQNKASKEELLKVVEAYFTSDTPKVIKTAVGKLNQTYQRIRYALFQIKDKGYNNVKYDLIQTEIDGDKAFRLKKG